MSRRTYGSRASAGLQGSARSFYAKPPKQGGERTTRRPGEVRRCGTATAAPRRHCPVRRVRSIVISLAAADENDLMATLASHQMDAPRGRHAQSGPRSALGPNVGPPV